LQSGLVEAHDDLTVYHDDRDGHASSEPDELLSGFGALDDVDVLVGDALRRKELFRRAARASGGTGVHDDDASHSILRFVPSCRAAPV
jgi:hypothetical protein